MPTTDTVHAACTCNSAFVSSSSTSSIASLSLSAEHVGDGQGDRISFRLEDKQRFGLQPSINRTYGRRTLSSWRGLSSHHVSVLDRKRDFRNLRSSLVSARFHLSFSELSDRIPILPNGSAGPCPSASTLLARIDLSIPPHLLTESGRRRSAFAARFHDRTTVSLRQSQILRMALSPFQQTFRPLSTVRHGGGRSFGRSTAPSPPSSHG